MIGLGNANCKFQTDRILTDIKPLANKAFAIVGILCFEDTFVQVGSSDYLFCRQPSPIEIIYFRGRVKNSNSIPTSLIC